MFSSRDSRTRFLVTGVSALALVGASVVPVAPSFAQNASGGASAQSTASSQPSGGGTNGNTQNNNAQNNTGNNTGTNNTSNESNTGAKITSVEGGPLNPVTGENTLTITGEGLDPNTSREGLVAEVYEVDADGDPVGDNLVTEDKNLNVTEDGHFSGTVNVKGNYDPQKRYALYISSYSAQGGGRSVHASQYLPVQQVDEKNVQPSFRATSNSSSDDELSSHLKTNTLTVAGTHLENATQATVRVQEVDQNGAVTNTLVTKDASADLKAGKLNTEVQVPGSAVKAGMSYRVEVEYGATDWAAVNVAGEFEGDTDSEAVGIVDGAPLSRSAAENHLKVAGGGFDADTAAQKGSKMRLILAEYDAQTEVTRDQEVVNTTVTPNSDGSFEADLAVPGNKLQAGKKYALRAYLENPEGRISSDITLRALVPVTN